jgi:hypothetical protein
MPMRRTRCAHLAAAIVWYIDRKEITATLRAEQTNEMRIGLLDTSFQCDQFTQRDVNYTAEQAIDRRFH